MVNTTRGARVTRAVMFRSALLAMLAVAGPAWAGDKPATPAPSAGTPNGVITWRASTPFVAATQPFTASSSVANPLAALTPPAPVPPDHPRRRRPVTIVTVPVAPPPQTVIVEQPIYYPVPVMAAASECTTPGYWAYRWVPYTATQTVWVEGSWAADGSWTDSHWEWRPYSSGYYEPIWTPEQRC